MPRYRVKAIGSQSPRDDFPRLVNRVLDTAEHASGLLDHVAQPMDVTATRRSDLPLLGRSLGRFHDRTVSKAAARVELGACVCRSSACVRLIDGTSSVRSVLPALRTPQSRGGSKATLHGDDWLVSLRGP